MSSGVDYGLEVVEHEDGGYKLWLRLGDSSFYSRRYETKSQAQYAGEQFYLSVPFSRATLLAIRLALSMFHREENPKQHGFEKV